MSTSGGSIPLSSVVDERLSPSFQEACQVLSRRCDIPGPFVILQGMAGDGMANTIDSIPELNLDLDDNESDSELEELAQDVGGECTEQMNTRVDDAGGVTENMNPTADRVGVPSAISSNLSLSNCSTSVNSNLSGIGHNENVGGTREENANSFESSSETSSLEVVNHPLDHAKAQTEERHISSASLPLDVKIDTDPGENSNVRNRNTSNPHSQALMTNHGLNLPIPQVASMSGCTYNSILPPIGVPYPAAPATTEEAEAATRKNNDHEIIDDSFIMVDDRKKNAVVSNDISINNSCSNDTDTNDFFDAMRSSSSPSLVTASEEAIDIGAGSTPSNPRYASMSESSMESLKEWNKTCRQKELRLRQEMLSQTSHSSHRRDLSVSADTASVADLSLTEDLWWRGERGCLLVFDAPPVCDEDSFEQEKPGKLPKIVGELAPGTAVMGTEMICIDISKHKNARGGMIGKGTRARPENNRQGMVQILKIESPMVGFITFSIDGYTLAGPGLPSSYVEPDVFLWKVTCPNGAYVRQGLELTSVHVDTIPFGSFVRVMRKTINAMGLTRLQIEALVETEVEEKDKSIKSSPHAATGSATRARNLLLRLSSSKGLVPKSDPKQQGTTKIVSGWISEKLNPLSGQSGPVVQQVPFPVPALFRVILPEGAVIRSGIELSSPQIGHASRGTILKVVGRQFTQHPMDRCIQRLKLAGGGGWVSVRLNRSSPRERPLVLEQTGIDGSFEPDAAGLFHIEKQLLVMHEFNQNIRRPDESDRQNMETIRRSLQRLGSCVSSINDDEENLGDSGELSHNDNSGAASHIPALYRSGVANACTTPSQRRLKGYKNKAQRDDPCLICLTEERNATIVHGETGHIACCLACARILKARGDKCPVCRLPIDSIIQQFWA